jgi:quercetin dioxygenase-like cupin family protein
MVALLKIFNLNEIRTSDVSNDPLFFGGKVTLQRVIEENHPGNKIQLVIVNFEPGARNKLHSHTSEQILIVTKGKGIIATKDNEYTVTPGMIAYISPGEEHWHGATKDSGFSHISILGDPHKFNSSETNYR